MIMGLGGSEAKTKAWVRRMRLVGYAYPTRW
jgi:hypothetical protein